MMSGALPGVAAVELQLKHGEIMSEFSRYRYNVILHLGASPAEPLALERVAPGDASSGARSLSLPCLSPVSPLYLPYISPTSPLYLPTFHQTAGSRQ